MTLSLRSRSPFRVARLPLWLEKLEDRTVPAFTASLVGSTATLTGDGASDTLEIGTFGGLVHHNRFTAGDPGFASDYDFDTAVAGDQTLTPSGARVEVNAGFGDDIVNVGSTVAPAAALGFVIRIDGQGDNDTINWLNGDDTTGRVVDIIGGASNSLLVPATGAQLLFGGPPGGALTVETINLFGSQGNDTFNFSGGDLPGVTLVANEGDDTITIAPGTTVGGNIFGSDGIDTLDYSAHTTPIAVNLGANAPELQAALDASQESPATASPALGAATVVYDNLTHTFDISVAVDGIDAAEVTGFHIHRAPFNVNGPIIVDFGTAGLVPTATGFTFLATDIALDPLHEAALLGGVTYLNVHTAEFPTGAIRGQIVSKTSFGVSNGTATGVQGTVVNFENATGGSGSIVIGTATFGDSIVGDKLANILRGGGGNDTIVGVQGNDTMLGEDGDDILIWSNGDNNDLMEGGAGTDLVQVNGAVAGDDIFTIGAGDGGRLDFQRANLVPFALDIGSTEGLTVVGHGGNDAFGVGDLTGVNDLTTLTLAGVDGDDRFDVLPQTNVGVTVLGGLPDTAPGDTLNVDLTGTIGATRTATPTGTTDSRSGNWSFVGLQSIDFFGFETLTPEPLTVLTGEPFYAVGADAGGSPAVRLFDDNQTELAALDAFDISFSGGVRVASADFNGDGFPDIVVGSGPGRPTLVRVIDGKTKSELFTITPFEASFTGGVYVAAGDINGDGVADLIITPDQGGGPRVRIFSGVDFKQLDDFFGIEDPAFRGGARAAVADVTGDGIGDLLVAAGFTGGPRIAVWNGTSLGTATRTKPFGDFFVFEQTLRNGVFITSGDLNGDGFAEVIAGGGPGGGPRVFALSGKDLLAGTETQLANFFAGDEANRGGIRIAAKDLDGDNRADLVVGDGTDAGSRVTGYLGVNIPVNGTPTEDFSTVMFPDFTGGVFVG